MDIFENDPNYNISYYYKKYKQCKDGVILIAWESRTNLTIADRLLRGFCYFIFMVYLFIGMAIIAQRFLIASELIVNAEKKVVLKYHDGSKTIFKTRVWNETIATLTLLTFAYSFPQIILTLLEVIGNDFTCGSIGPSLVLGCAMFNITVIHAIIIVVVPKGVSLRIKDYPVYYVLLFWSFVGYLWMYIIIAVWEPDRLLAWQCIILASIFPVSVINAYIANKRMLLFKRFRYGSTTSLDSRVSNFAVHYKMDAEEDVDFEQARTQYINTFKYLRKKYPYFDLEKLELMAHEKILSDSQKTRGIYRVMATQKIFGTGGIVATVRERAEIDMIETKSQLQRVQIKVLDHDAELSLFFEPGHYTILDTVEKFQLRVVRRGRYSSFTTVDYKTGDGTAIANRNYLPKTGTLYFPAGVTEQRFPIEILNDGSFKEDLQFYVTLKNPQRPAVLTTPKMATIMIIDTNHSGVFEFSEDVYNIEENIGKLDIPVLRTCGARGEVKLPYKTILSTAVPGKHYEHQSGSLLFANEEIKRKISLKIYDEHSYEKSVTFAVELGTPEVTSEIISNIEKKPLELRTESENVILLGKPRLGDKTVTMVNINENSLFKSKVDMLVEKANSAILVGTSNWNESYNVLRRKSIGERETHTENIGWPALSDYVMHWITIFWKTIFTFVPPTNIADGYFCFFISLLISGIITTLLIDVAAQFGCTLGIADMVTAVFFVAIGTMVPDIVACELSALHDKVADDTLCGLFSSNTVTIFGVGLAWTVGCLYQQYNGREFYMPRRNLAFMTAIFIPTQIIVAIIIFIRGRPPIQAELGGPIRIKYITAGFLFSLWIIFIILCILRAYHII